MQNQKSKITYWVNGRNTSKEEFSSLVGEYFKYFEGSDVKAVDYSSVESLFDGDYKSKRQINEHLRKVLGESKTAGNSTRHKYTGEGSFHKESDFKEDVITSSNRGEIETMDYLNKMYSDLNTITKNPLQLDTHAFPHFPKRGKIIKYEPKKEDGVKETEGKKDYSEINLEILDLMAERFTANKHKYPKGNMKKPIDIKSLEWALFRHIKKMIQPIEEDTETYKDHLSAVLCNCSMILDQLNLQNQK